MDSNKIILKLPQSVSSNYSGFSSLLEICSPYLIEAYARESIVLDFTHNSWFEANLLPILYAYMIEGHKIGIVSEYRNNHDSKLTDLLTRNGFAKLCFGKEHKPHATETCVPFKIFNASDTYNFGNYIDAELVRYFPSMEDRVKKDLSSYIQEIFGNAQIHGGSDKVFTCGQFYPRSNKIDFTIVDIGWTFQSNVVNFFEGKGERFIGNSIGWAVQPEHTTKAGVSGGFGLSLMRDFIKFNKGKFQIVSGMEYWELSGETETENSFKNLFPGTIVNIEIDQGDKNYYFYVNRHDSSDDIF